MRTSDLRILADFLPDLQAADFSAGKLVEPRLLKDGVFNIPYVNLSGTANAFFEVAYANGWVRNDIPWMDWLATEEAKGLFSSPDRVASASGEQLSRMLTVCIRRDRFCEGALMADFESGLILRIVLRAKALLDDAERD